MSSHIYLINLEADSLLVLNCEIIATADSSTCLDLPSMANKMSAALGVPVKTINSSVPADIQDTWNYGDIVECLIESGDITPPNALSTFVLPYTSITEEGFMLPNVSSFEAEDLPHAVEQLYDSLRGTSERILYLDGDHGVFENHNAPALCQLSANEYILNPVCRTTASIYVGNIQISVHMTHEGVIVDAYPVYDGSQSIASFGVEWLDACDESSSDN